MLEYVLRTKEHENEKYVLARYMTVEICVYYHSSLE